MFKWKKKKKKKRVSSKKALKKEKNKSKKKKRSFLSISGNEDLGNLINSTIPNLGSDSNCEQVPSTWEEMEINRWGVDEVSSFFHSLECVIDVSSYIFENNVTGIDILERDTFKAIVSKEKSEGKKKLMNTYYEYFKFLEVCEEPLRMGRQFDSMIQKLFERHNRENLVEGCEPKILSDLIRHLIDRDLLHNLYFHDKFLNKTINHKKFNVMVGREENKSQFFGIFFHPLLLVVHADALFSNCWWLESEDDDGAVFRDNLNSNGEKKVLRFVEYELIDTFETKREIDDEEKLINVLVKHVVRCNKNESVVNAPEFIEKLVTRISDYEATSHSLLNKLKPFCAQLSLTGFEDIDLD